MFHFFLTFLSSGGKRRLRTSDGSFVCPLAARRPAVCSPRRNRRLNFAEPSDDASRLHRRDSSTIRPVKCFPLARRGKRGGSGPVRHRLTGPLLCQRGPCGHTGTGKQKKKNPIRAEKDVLRGDEGLLQRCGAASRSGNVNIFKAERSCHRAADVALRIHSHWQNFFLLSFYFSSTFIIFSVAETPPAAAMLSTQH